MSRSVIFPSFLLGLVGLFIVPLPVVAQGEKAPFTIRPSYDSGPVVAAKSRAMEPPKVDLLYDKGRARARFEAEQATPEQLARDVAETTRGMALARFQEFISGRGTLDLFLEAMSRAATTNLAFSKSEAETASVQATLWLVALNAEAVNRVRYQAGKISIADYDQTRRARLEAEQNWKDKGRLRGFITASFFSQDSLMPPKEMAKAWFEASRTSPGEIALARRDAAREELAARMQEFLTGRGTLDIILKACEQGGEAERALSKDELALAKAWAGQWRNLALIDAVSRGRYEWRVLSRADQFLCRYARLDTERRWFEKGRLTGILPFAWDLSGVLPNAPVGIVPHPSNGGKDNVLKLKDLARARFEAAQRRPELVAQDQLETVREMMYERFQEFIAGRGTLGIFLDCGRLLLATELSVAGGKAAQHRALEQRWAQAYLSEQANQARYNAGKIGIADYCETRLDRLEVEIALLWERKQTEKK
jgi:hypothetical protein